MSTRLWTVFVPRKEVKGLGVLEAQEVWHTGNTLIWRIGKRKGRSTHRYLPWQDFQRTMGHLEPL